MAMLNNQMVIPLDKDYQHQFISIHIPSYSNDLSFLLLENLIFDYRWAQIKPQTQAPWFQNPVIHLYWLAGNEVPSISKKRQETSQVLNSVSQLSTPHLSFNVIYITIYMHPHFFTAKTHRKGFLLSKTLVYDLIRFNRSPIRHCFQF